jgi:hypothetical protein
VSKLVLDAKGLVLAPAELSRTPGALTVADNVNVEAPGVIRSRNGWARAGTALAGNAWKFITTKELGSTVLFARNNGAGSYSTALTYGNGTGAWTDISGTVTNQPATRMQAAVSKRNHYITSDEGVRRLESDMTLYAAGMPKGLAIDTSVQLAALTVLSGAPGVVVADGGSVAYRVTWCKKDAQGIVMEGAPSSRTVIFNNTRTSGWVTTVTKDVTCRIIIPRALNTANTALTTSYFWRLYRSAEAGVGIVPSDDMNLVAEGFLTAGQITARYVDVTDSTPEAFRALGPALYTNPNIGVENGVVPGEANANQPPPRARDVVLFSECLFYSDLLYPADLEFTLLSTVAATGLTAADTLTIGGIVYTAHATTAADNQFVVVTVAGGASASEALARTAQNLVNCINGSTTNTTTYAYYVPSANDLPGLIRIESRTASATFTAVASAHGTAYRPDLTSAVSSTSDTYANGFTYSKPAQGDAVPFVNLGFIGRDDTAILRMMVLGESIFIFTDSGLYRLLGSTFDDFQVQEFDLSFRLRGREMVTVCDDAIYAWGYEGIARITAAGVEYISNAIEPLVWAAINAVSGTEAWFGSYAWATSFRSRHKVLFWYPASTSTGNCNKALVYDTRMEAWTTWSTTPGGTAGAVVVDGLSCGAVRVSDDLLVMGEWNTNGASSFIYIERRAFAATDYKDDAYGDSSFLNLAITKTVTWNAIPDSPERATHWDELHLFYNLQSGQFSAWTTPTAVSLTFTGDVPAVTGAVVLAPTATMRQGRAIIPTAVRRAARMTVKVVHSTVGEYFALEGLALHHLPAEGTATVRT